MDLYSLLKIGISELEKYQEVPPEARHGLLVKTGIDVIDKNDPLLFGTAHYVASRPGQGKTRLIFHILDYLCRYYKTALYLAEDTPKNIAIRLLSTFTRSFTTKQVYLDKIDTRAYDGMMRVMSRFSDETRKNCDVEFSADWSLEKYIDAWRNAEKSGVRVIVLDYVQLIKTPSNLGVFETHSLISSTIKNFFENSAMCFIGVLQINRDAEKGFNTNPNSFPSLANLFGSSSYERDASSIIMIQRLWEKSGHDVTGWQITPNSALLIRKNRHGGDILNFTVDKNYVEIKNE